MTEPVFDFGLVCDRARTIYSFRTGCIAQWYSTCLPDVSKVSYDNLQHYKKNSCFLEDKIYEFPAFLFMSTHIL
jgi:hypothetical protein